MSDLIAQLFAPLRKYVHKSAVDPVMLNVEQELQKASKRFYVVDDQRIRQAFERYFLKNYRESSGSISKEVALRTASDTQFRAGYLAAIEDLEHT